MENIIEKSIYIENYGNVLLNISIEKDNDGVYSAIILNLPGCGSCGETEQEAILNAQEAVSGVIEDYQENNERVPWIE
ncbi:MAG: hypothetical protein EKK64_00540 [Neisseriaceae bacterium]|nr:MAG: hypothetical protein EKK64_00540 [Neisseriaceae bacterium]